jgi:NAD(P)-dependent dehydrogenase (short-subunit alcohol dehydrogenase family)
MMSGMSDPPSVLVFGARNSGAAIARERVASGHRVVAVSRTQATLDRLREAVPGVETQTGDASQPADVDAALLAAARLGRLDLVVNAVTAVPRDQPFGGGPLAEAPSDRLNDWMSGIVPHAFNILRQGAAAMAPNGGGTLIQLAGGSSRRGMPGGGPWAAAQFALRAMVQSLAQEMRPVGVHVALLVIDGVIETDRAPVGDRPEHTFVGVDDIAAAVAYLAGQSPRAWTHELVITPVGDTWVP